MKPAARIAARIALGALGVLLGLGGAELLVRLVAPQPFVTGSIRWEEHPTLGFRAQTDCEVAGELGGHINSLGLRGPDIPPKGDDEHRVLVIGDSFTYGAGVPEREAFPVLLTTELRKRDDLFADGSTVTAINAGTVSYGTRRELLWLESYGDAIEADEVLLAFFVGNDFGDNVNLSMPRIIDGQRVSADAGEADWQLRLRILRHESHLYRWWRKQTFSDPGQNRLSERAQRQRTPAVDRGLGPRIAIYARPGREPEQERERLVLGWSETRTALDGMLAWCDARDLQLKVVIIPDLLQVEGDLVAKVEERYPALAGGGVDPRRPQAEVLGWCAEHDVPALDLLLPFRRRTSESGESLHLGYDPHWNESGHRFAAELMASRLWPRN